MIAIHTKKPMPWNHVHQSKIWSVYAMTTFTFSDIIFLTFSQFFPLSTSSSHRLDMKPKTNGDEKKFFFHPSISITDASSVNDLIRWERERLATGNIKYFLNILFFPSSRFSKNENIESFFLFLLIIKFPFLKIYYSKKCRKFMACFFSCFCCFYNDTLFILVLFILFWAKWRLLLLSIRKRKKKEKNRSNK